MECRHRDVEWFNPKHEFETDSLGYILVTRVEGRCQECGRLLHGISSGHIDLCVPENDYLEERGFIRDPHVPHFYTKDRLLVDTQRLQIRDKDTQELLITVCAIPDATLPDLLLELEKCQNATNTIMESLLKGPKRIIEEDDGYCD